MNVFEGLFLFPFSIICSFLIFIALFPSLFDFLLHKSCAFLICSSFCFLFKIVMDCYEQLDLVDNLV